MQSASNQIMIFGGKKITDHHESIRSSVIFIFDTDAKSMTVCEKSLPN